MQKHKTLNKESNENAVHVQISNPSSLRKNILKTAIDSSKLIELAHEIKSLRQEEVTLLSNLKKVMNQIKDLESNLKKAIPKIPEEHHEDVIKNVTREEFVHVEYDDELFRLKQELAHIEGRLKEYN